MCFLNRLRNLLDDIESISKEEVTQASRLVRERHQFLQKPNLKREGPCLGSRHFHCGSSRISYGKLVNHHYQHGNRWLSKLFNKFRNEITIKLNRPYHQTGSALLLNGYSIRTVSPYLCDACKEAIESIKVELLEEDEKHLKREKLERRIRRRRQEEYDSDVINGDVKASIKDRFLVLRRRMDDEAVERNVALPYKEFLDTCYWEIVRKYVLEQRRFRCELCGEGNRILHVHHKTYKNHGAEHLHLDDLIVLCKTCHSKHHDVLVDGEPESSCIRR